MRTTGILGSYELISLESTVQSGDSEAQSSGWF